MKKKVKVLIADDEEHIRSLIKQVCESMNCDVIGEAEDGRQAVELFRSLQPNMILLDINMPHMDGKKALKAIKSESPNAVVIMLTSVSSTDTLKECLEAGASNYIRKDTPLKEMKRYLKETWDEFRSQKI